jgi:alpha-1,3-mannosyltransferase
MSSLSLPRLLLLLQRYPRLVSIFTTILLFILFSLSHPDPSSDSFQFPSLLPSRYPPPIHHAIGPGSRLAKADDLELPINSLEPDFEDPTPSGLSALERLYSNFTTVYSQHSDASPPLPIYPNPHLTPDQKRRYAHLKSPQLPLAHTVKGKTGPAHGKYMMTTLTRQITSQLPDLLNAMHELVSYLGPEHVSYSILEGPSDDCTPFILDEVLRPMLRNLGVPDSQVHIITNEPKINFDEHNRIQVLAGLRNKALSPLWEDNDPDMDAGAVRTVGKDVVAVVYFNDVFLHAADILEVLHQHVVAGQGEEKREVGITTAWDWMTREPEHFYDVWVARTVCPHPLDLPLATTTDTLRLTQATSSTPSTFPGGHPRLPSSPRLRYPRKHSAASGPSRPFPRGTPSQYCLPRPFSRRTTLDSGEAIWRKMSVPLVNVRWLLVIFGKSGGGGCRSCRLFR